MAKLDYELTYFINIGVECSLRQLLDHGFFHADPHPGLLARFWWTKWRVE